MLHTGLGPDAAASGYMAKVIGIAVQEGGMPIPRGGGDRLVDALTGVITDNGGACLTGQDVERVLVEGGRAIGVRVVGGETSTASRAVLANVTPAQLLRSAARGQRGAGARSRGRRAVPVRTRRDADPLRALRATALGG